MAKKSTELYGPLRTPPGDSLGGESVSGLPDAKSVPDPLGYVKTKK
ncbi:MAG: hypothetical protein QN120_05260 [Armatimonadota bacterium]|nr:hypothetical protein [Armatimonadota bacterium]